MQYQDVSLGKFLDRPNRFIANCILEGHPVVVHVKNTGRGKELLISGVTVALAHTSNPKRKTSYDLIAVKKGERWINIDSQLPNDLTQEALLNQRLTLPGLDGEITELKREVTFGDSRVDFMGMTTTNRQFLIEVKGVTLEKDGLAAFPDAPTIRAVKHVKNLMMANDTGIQAYLCFIVQMANVNVMTIFQQRAPELFEVIQEAQHVGVHLIAYNCDVGPSAVLVDREITIDLDRHFTE